MVFKMYLLSNKAILDISILVFGGIMTQSILVWYICLHLPYTWTKCRWIYQSHGCYRQGLPIKRRLLAQTIFPNKLFPLLLCSPPMSQTVKRRFRYSTVSTLKPTNKQQKRTTKRLEVNQGWFNYPFLRYQTIQMYGKFEGFPLNTVDGWNPAPPGM